MAETSKMIRASSCPRGQMVLRVTKDLEGSEDHLVATSDIGSWMKVMPALFKAAPSEDYEWWYPTPKGVGDAWAPLVLGDGHRLSLEAWCDKWKQAPRRQLNLALEDDWRHVIEAWDHGCKSRYRSRARRCGKQLAQRLQEGNDLEAALNACWEFAHEPSNATSCGALARQVANNVSSEDPAIRIAACRAAWRLCEADEGICRELVRRGLASALVEAVERRCDVALGCLVALAHRDDSVRNDVLASERGLRALVTSAALTRSTLALGGLLFGVIVASSEVREHLCVASDVVEEAVVLPEPVATDAPAPAPEDVASAPAPAVTASSGALAALAPLLATDDARLAAASVGVLASDPALTGVYPGATLCVDACALLVERSLNKEDVETAHIAAKAADACASLQCSEVPDVERLLDLTKRAVEIQQPKVARAVASAHARVIARGVSYHSVEKWILSVLGELLPSLDERVTRALPEAIKTENGRKAALSTNCFRVLCELLKSETYTSQVLEPVACSLEILSRGGYDPCSVVLKPNAWNDVSHVQPFIDSFALTGKAYRDNRERRTVVGFGAIAVARLARHWASSCAKKGKYAKDSPLLKRKCLGTLCAITRLLAEGGVDAFTCAASTALRILLLGAASIPKECVNELLDRGAVEKAVVSVLVNKSPEEQMDIKDENGVQARREMLELVWKLTKDDCDDVEASRIDARGFGPALVKPLCALLRSDHARSPSPDSKELTGAACRVLLRLCCETAVGARELERNGSDVVTEVLRCLEPGNNALIQETALFSVQLLAARDRRLGVQLAKQGSKRIAHLLDTTHTHDVRKAALHALLNLSVAKDACWPVAKYALEPTLDASDEPSELRTYAVSLLANLSRDARVCYQIHLRKLRVDFGNCERKKLAKLNKPSRSSMTVSLKNKLTKYDTVQRLFEDSICTVKSTEVTTPPIDPVAAKERRLEAKRQLSAMPNSLWTQPKGDKTIRKMLKDAVQRPRTAPLLSRGGVAFETPLLREAPRMGSFRVGPAHDKGGVSPWNPVVARGAAAPKLGKRCVLAPGGARNTFRFPPGLATGNDGETQLCCFKSCVGAKLYVGDCPTFFLPKKKDEDLDDVPEDKLDGPEVSAASKALRNLSFAKAIGKFKSTLEKDDDDETEYTAYHLFRSTRVACEVLHPGQWRDGTPPPGWVPDDHENEFAMTFNEKPPSCILVRAPFPPHAPTVTQHYMSELEQAPPGSWGRLAPCPLMLFCTKRPVIPVEEVVPEEPESTWTLEASIWAPRKLESDAKDFYDTPKVLHKGFARDWTYLTQMPRFPNFAKRLAGYSMRDAKDAPQSVIEALKHGAEVLYGALLPILKHYAAVDLASNNAFDLNMTDWIAYLRATDCFDDDEDSPTHFTPEHAQIVFRQCKVEIGVSKEMRAANDDEHLCRYEFLDANLRVVEAKYDLDHEPPDSHSREDHILESVERFRDEHLSKLPYELHECPDTFRRESLYNEEVDVQLWRYDKILKGIWKAYGNAHRVAGRAKFSPNVFAEFLTKCMLCHNADARVAARRSFAFGRTFFVDTCDAGYKELTYINFLEALCRFIHVEVEVPLFGHLREIGVNELCEFYAILHFRSTNGADAIHAINELRRMLTPDTELTLAEKLALVLPHMLACFSVTCGGDFETKLDHVRLNTLLTEEQKQKWIKKKCHISRGDCEHVLALDEFKAVTHAVDKKHVFAEAVQLKKSAEKGVSDGAGVWAASTSFEQSATLLALMTPHAPLAQFSEDDEPCPYNCMDLPLCCCYVCSEG